jgi:hypothetical protein
MASFDYFLLLEKTFQSEKEITSISLHREVASPVHRRHLLAYRFLLDVLGIEKGGNARDHAKEERRLSKVFSRAKGTRYLQILENFVEEIRSQGLAIHTLRLYAAVAQTFCERVGLDASAAWAAEAIEEFLTHSPGSASSLSRFVRYCRERYGWEVCMPAKRSLSVHVMAEKRTRERLRRAIDATDGRQIETLKLTDVARIIAAATGLPLSRLMRAPSDDGLLPNFDGVRLDDDARIYPGHPLHPYAVQWQRLLSTRSKRVLD